MLSSSLTRSAELSHIGPALTSSASCTAAREKSASARRHRLAPQSAVPRRLSPATLRSSTSWAVSRSPPSAGVVMDSSSKKQNSTCLRVASLMQSLMQSASWSENSPVVATFDFSPGLEARTAASMPSLRPFGAPRTMRIRSTEASSFSLRAMRSTTISPKRGRRAERSSDAWSCRSDRRRRRATPSRERRGPGPLQPSGIS
mmetsp:Transcript_5454/g.17268  ORF Transcript_5454/g.17268 Transcript_5454/m.17268 type:complete len:202 (+) Transcript_5454:549-1154(+)